MSPSEWCRLTRASWRRLAGGAESPEESRPTLVAVSGGADSTALAVALATLDRPRIILGTVLHDLRPAELVHDDLAAVEELASGLGVRLVVEHVTTGDGNAEHEARTARYRALENMARDTGCTHIATAHHAGDQLETMLLALLRGGSPSAIAGIRESRRLGDGALTLIRPMLESHPDTPSRVCAEFAFTPRIDATNADPARRRAMLRQTAIRSLLEMNPACGPSLMSASKRLLDLLDDSASQQATDIGLEPLDA